VSFSETVTTIAETTGAQVGKRQCEEITVKVAQDFNEFYAQRTYFRNWRKDGTWVAIHEKLRDWVRSEQQRKPDPSEAIIDSQSVKTAAMLNQSVGYDAGKKIKGRNYCFMSLLLKLKGLTSPLNDFYY
jgi:hypothetical protein